MFLASVVAPFALIAVHVNDLNAYASAGWIVAIVGLVFAQFAALLGERGAAETQLRTRERELQTLVDNAPDLIVRYGVDKRPIYANAPAAEFLGGSPGSSDATIEAAIDAVLATKAQIDVTYERTTRRGVRHAFEARLVPQLSESGAIESIISIARDVTEAQKHGTGSSSSSRACRALLWATDQELRPVSVSGGALLELGWGSDALERLTALVGTAEFPAFHAAHRRALNGELVDLEQSVDGRVFRCHVEPLTNARGERVGTIGVGLDVTEQSRLEEQILQAQKMEAIGQLAGTIAHDFNNLLTGISGYAEFAASKLSGQRRGGRRRRDQARVRSRGLADQPARDLLAQTRVETRVVDANGIVAGMSTFLARVIGEGMTVRYALDPAPAPVKIDPRPVRTGDPEPLDQRPRRDGRPRRADDLYADPDDRFLLEVADQGAGMDEATRARIFDPFYTTKEPGKGTGLGLPSVLAIVSEANGSIDVVSEPGAGATFTVSLPIDPSTPDYQAAQTRAGRRRKRVDPARRRQRAGSSVTETMLQTLGYRVVAAETSDEALRLASLDSFRLLVTDVVMPDMDGRRLAGRSRRPAGDRRHPHLRLRSGATTSRGASRLATFSRGVSEQAVQLRELATTIRGVLDASASAAERDGGAS